MITFRGAVFVATALFVFLLARLTQVGWLYLLDAMLWGAILLSLALPWLAVMSLSARLRVVRHRGEGLERERESRPRAISHLPPLDGPAEGEVVQVELWIKNRMVWPRYLLSVSYDCPLASPAERQQRFFVPRLDGSTSLALVSTVQCHRRGLHQFKAVSVESKAPFGLFRQRIRLPAPLTLLVYPQVHHLHRLPLLEGTQGTATRPQKTWSGQEIAGSRHYSPGDPLRHIHWRNTARTGRPMVKEFEDSQENTLIIAFDSSQDTGQEQETVLEYSIKIAASVAGYVMEHGRGVRLLTGKLPGQEMPWTLLLKELALLEAGQGPGLPALVESIPAQARVLALVSEVDSLGIEALRRRAGYMSGLAVVVLEEFGDAPTQHAGPQGLGTLATSALPGMGVPVVSCHPGGLLEALRLLETMWSTRQETWGTVAR